MLTNSLDVLRANIQVRQIKSIVFAAKMLWAEERYNVFVKGLSARIVHSAFSSTFIAAGNFIEFVKLINFNALITGYETLKRLSLHEEFRDSVRW